MSKLVSVKIDDEIFKKTEKFTRESHLSRNAYINRALRLMNWFYERRRLKSALRRESIELGRESMDVLSEFEDFQDEGL